MDYCFFLNDDDDDDEDKKDDDSEAFLCENCGATESYEDGSGKLTCSNCYTQSQNAISQEETMDYEDMENMANKKGGRMIRQNLGRKLGAGRKRGRERQPLEELDRSKPLPDLTVCLKGFQTVLQGGVKRVGKILRLKEDELKAVTDTVAKILFGYVIAWRDGAEKYGAIYPDLRFSMRDLFLSTPYKTKLMLMLSYKVAETVRLEFNDPTKKKTGPQLKSDSSSDSDSDSRGDKTRAKSPRRITGNETLKRKQPVNFFELSEILAKNDKGREEAALALRPSMNLAAAIIWLAISRVGITPGLMVDWIANGSMPLINAFDRLLSSDDQNNLRFIRGFFSMPSLPTADSIEKLAAKVAIACAIKSTPQVPQYSDSEDDDETNKASREPKVVERLRYVAVECVPNMIGRFVVNLGLREERVLDIAMSLIGQPPSGSPEDERMLPPQLEGPQQWLPPPLQRAHPKRINSPEYALAVIIVACKMCPGWENWSYGRQYGGRGDQCGVRPVEARHHKETPGDSVCHRFVPWNEEQFNLLQDEQVSDYLDFFEETMLNRSGRTESTHPFPAFSDLLDKACKKDRRVETSKSKSQNSTNRGDEVTQSTGKVATDFSRYISYPDKLSHTKHIPYQEKTMLTGEPFHVCYSRLVEYISYKTHVAAYKIHAIVAELDEEVVALCGKRNKFRDKDYERKRRHRRKAKRRKFGAEPENVQSLPSLEHSLMMELSQAGPMDSDADVITTI